ncbi:MAG: hypothetical protein BWY86_00751 [Candidatus Aminicenantes bacterium ADurb.Bin508]|nr:MAG: hypothetical protein BWY86_00751 [Candidatus Aminicenantes bacterium ADurb.Bin508]
MGLDSLFREGCQNGLSLESSLEEKLDTARSQGCPEPLSRQQEAWVVLFRMKEQLTKG